MWIRAVLEEGLVCAQLIAINVHKIQTGMGSVRKEVGRIAFSGWIIDFQAGRSAIKGIISNNPDEIINIVFVLLF